MGDGNANYTNMKKNKAFSFLSLLYTLGTIALFVLAFWGVTYTADWAGYEKSFEYDLERRDLAFGFIGRIMASFGQYDYQSVYRAHVVLMGVLFPVFISRWQKNPLFVAAVFIVLTYVGLANQIRFYVAFPLALIGLYELICNKNWFLFAIFSVLAYVFHSSIFFFILVVLIFNFFILKRNRLVSDILLINIVLAIISFFGLKYIIPLIGDFSVYLVADNLSTLAGGVYSAFPSMLAIGLVLYSNNKIKKTNPELLSNKYYKYLLVLSIATSLLLTLSFRTQIVRHRFINPLLLIWILYFLFVARNCKPLKQFSGLSVAFIVLITAAWQTIVPFYLGVSDTLIDPELILTLNSIEF